MVATSWVVFVFEAAKMLSAEDLKILVAAKEARMLAVYCAVCIQAASAAPPPADQAG